MNYKRITLLSGHYGSGKTNIAVNMALQLRKIEKMVSIADLDIVNPYFRTLDSKAELDSAGVHLIVSDYANTNIDAPALPQEMYSIVDDISGHYIVDVGGDDRGALALGRLSARIEEEDNYDMLLVINKYRPLTPDAFSAIEVMREIEFAGRLKFTGIINNSNLGMQTTPDDVLSSVSYANEVSSLAGLPVVATSVDENIAEDIKGKIENLFIMKLQKRPV